MAGYDWPPGFDQTPESLREPYPHGFQVDVQDAFDNIITQLERMGVDDYTIESAADHQTRNPNIPYAGADPDDPSIVVRYHEGRETFAIPCDRWDNLRDNAQAVAKYIDAKRALDRYGIETRTTEWETQIIESDGGAKTGATSGPGRRTSATPDDQETTDTEVYDPGGAGARDTCQDCGAALPDLDGLAYCPDCGVELSD